ncbi:MAG: RNA polymerase sigma-I factor [Firmicutes bacterium]|nr:RNA polymerase sigma-I factor [Candidatus Fermentithermobacillaceae bacterium]
MNLPFFKSQKQEPVESRVARARDGDTLARDKLIRDYTPFVLKVVSSVTGRYISLDKDDEASIGLLAFNEAIDAYTSKRAGFLAFAATVIKRRVIDHYRRENNWKRMVQAEARRNDSNGNVSYANVVAEDIDWQEALERRDEIERWKEHLSRCGITLDDLIRATPKHQDARERILRVAEILAQHRHIAEKIESLGRLPIDDILELLPDDIRVSRKTLQRHSTYIVGILLAASGDYPFLKRYLSLGKGGDR